jgi:hypothetical protein
MAWEVTPAPPDDAEREVLVQAAEQAVDAARPSAWWSSGFEALGEFGEMQSVPQGRAARPEDGVLSRARI